MSQHKRTTPEQDWQWEDDQTPEWDYIPFEGESVPHGAPACWTGTRRADPIAAVVGEAVRGRFEDWPADALAGWLLMHDCPARTAAYITCYIEADRTTLLMAAAGYEPLYARATFGRFEPMGYTLPLPMFAEVCNV